MDGWIRGCGFLLDLLEIPCSIALRALYLYSFLIHRSMISMIKISDLQFPIRPPSQFQKHTNVLCVSNQTKSPKPEVNAYATIKESISVTSRHTPELLMLMTSPPHLKHKRTWMNMGHGYAWMYMDVLRVRVVIYACLSMKVMMRRTVCMDCTRILDLFW